MGAGQYNITKMTKVLYDQMSGVSGNIFTSRPNSVSETLDDFIVVSFPVRLIDRLAIGSTSARISIFVRDKKSGCENLTRIGVLQDAVFSKLPFKKDGYEFGKGLGIPGGSDGNGFSVFHIQTQVIIL